MGNFLTSKKFTFVLGFLGLYLISAGISWAAFTYLGKSGGISAVLSGLEGARSKINLDLPRTEVCPINGEKFTKIEKDIWESRRPITAVIENHVDSRPTEGLHKADVVYEAVAEGGITRFLAVFYCGASAADVRVAPIRSARIYFINWAAEYGLYPLFTHVGGANRLCGDCYGGVKPKSQVDPKVDAYGALEDLGWRVPRGNDFDTTYDSGFPTFYRDPERLGHPIASEHTMVSTTDLLFKQGADRGFEFKDSDGNTWNKTFVSWKFKDEKPASNPETSSIAFEFWNNKSDYDVRWEYDKENNRYLRFNGGKPHTDLGSGEQFSAKNVVIQFVDEEGPVDSEHHMYYEVEGEGPAIIFQNGEIIEGTWEKPAQTSRTVFKDKSGKEIEFVRGRIWIEGVPSSNDIDY